MRALAVAVAVASAGCPHPAAKPREPAHPVLRVGEPDVQRPPGWSADTLHIAPIAKRDGGSITDEFHALWQAMVTPKHDVTQPVAMYRRRLASGYALAYGQSSSVSLYVVYTDDRCVALVATGVSTAAEPALARMFDAIKIHGVPPSKTPLFTKAEIAGHWSTLGIRLGTSADPEHPSNAPGEGAALESKGHVDWYSIGPGESGRLLRNAASGLWRVDDDILVTERHHEVVKQRIWARGTDALYLSDSASTQPPFVSPADAINTSRFKEL